MNKMNREVFLLLIENNLVWLLVLLTENISSNDMEKSKPQCSDDGNNMMIATILDHPTSFIMHKTQAWKSHLKRCFSVVYGTADHEGRVEAELRDHLVFFTLPPPVYTISGSPSV